MIQIAAHLRNDENGTAHIAIHAGDPEPAPVPCGVLTMATEEAAELVARIRAGDLGPANVTPVIAAHVLFHYGETGGMEAGEFTKQLIETIVRADRTNLLRMAAVYPGYATAISIATLHDGGTRILQDVARKMLIPAAAQDGGNDRG